MPFYSLEQHLRDLEAQRDRSQTRIRELEQALEIIATLYHGAYHLGKLQDCEHIECASARRALESKL
jgi:hypothetical protein